MPHIPTPDPGAPSSGQTATTGTIDFNSQQDPLLLLLQNCTNTQNLEVLLNSSVGNVLEEWSQGATDSIDAGDNELSALATAMSGLTGSALTAKSVQYQTAQTKVSNINNQCSTIMQGGGTMLSNGSDAEAQVLQFCQVSVDNMQNLNQLIMSHAN